MIGLVAKAGALAVVGSVCALTLRRYVPELSLVLGLVTAGALVVLMMGVLSQVKEGMETLAGYAALDESLTGPVYKVAVIAVLTRLISQICRDAGEGTVAVCCELAGVFAALAATLPLLRRVLSLLSGLLA